MQSGYLHLRVDAPDGESEMNVNLFLLKRFEWKLCQFFTSIVCASTAKSCV